MRPLRAFGRDLQGRLPGLAVALAVWLAARQFAAAEVDLTFRAETLYLGLLAALVLAAVAWAAPRPALEIGAGAPLAVLALWALPGGPTRAAVVTVVLVAAFTAAAWRTTARASAAAAWHRRALDQATIFVPLALGAQVLLRGRLLVEAAGDPRALAAFWLGALCAGLAAAILAGRWGARCAAGLAAATALVAPGFNRTAMLWLVALAALSEIGARLQPDRFRAAVARASGHRAAAVLAALLTTLFTATALLASPPWLRREPLADAFGLAVLSRSGVLLVERKPVTLDATHPDRRVLLTPTPVSELVLDTQLAHAATLPAGTPLARFEIVDDAGGRHGFALEAGRHSGEWAALRPDVAATAGFAAPNPWRSQLDPSGRFFAQTYRARWRLDRPVKAVQLEVVRDPALPAATVIVFQRAELRP